MFCPGPKPVDYRYRWRRLPWVGCSHRICRGGQALYILPRIVLLVASSVVIFIAFILATKLALNRKVRRREIWLSAGTTTVGLLLLQNLGGYLFSHELKNLNSLYGTFAAVLGIFFLIYLQSQVLVYSMEINSVRALKLGPRSSMGEDNK